MRSESLRGLQAAMLRDLTGGSGTARERARTFSPPPRGSVEDRWGVYTFGYLARIAEALENDYPALARILGPAALRSLVARYVRACPPRSHDLGRAGDRLPGFLERDPLVERLPFLPDLARFEWAVARSFVAPEALALRWEELAAAGPEAAADRPLALRPGTALVRSGWPLLDLWECRDRPDEAVDLEVLGRPSLALVHRRGLTVHARQADEHEARILDAAAEGATLARIQESLGGDEPASDALVVAFRRLVGEGIFARALGPGTAF